MADPETGELPTHPPITLEELIAGPRPMTVLQRIEAHALGLLPMEPSEINAAKLFLSKTQPDLKAMEISGKGGKPISVVIQATDEDAKL